MKEPQFFTPCGGLREIRVLKEKSWQKDSIVLSVDNKAE
jgi:hypothetical protein